MVDSAFIRERPNASRYRGLSGRGRLHDCRVRGQVYIAQIAKRTIVSDDALSVLVPILEEIVGYDSRQI